jgi:hypothetical protein
LTVWRGELGGMFEKGFSQQQWVRAQFTVRRLRGVGDRKRMCNLTLGLGAGEFEKLRPTPHGGSATGAVVGAATTKCRVGRRNRASPGAAARTVHRRHRRRAGRMNDAYQHRNGVRDQRKPRKPASPVLPPVRSASQTSASFSSSSCDMSPIVCQVCPGLSRKVPLEAGKQPRLTIVCVQGTI